MEIKTQNEICREWYNHKEDDNVKWVRVDTLRQTFKEVYENVCNASDNNAERQVGVNALYIRLLTKLSQSSTDVNSNFTRPKQPDNTVSEGQSVHDIGLGGVSVKPDINLRRKK